MVLVMLQVLTVTAILIFAGVLLVELGTSKAFNDENSGEVLWTLHAVRIGSGHKNWFQRLRGERFLHTSVPLMEDQYCMGNRMRDDLYVDSAGERVKLYLNVQNDSIFLTVLTGEVMIQNQVYRADVTSRIPLKDNDTVLLEDVELLFLRSDMEGRW